jgi:hypothetical protein
MKAAFVAGGQPRFTPDILDIFRQVKGVTKADIFMVLWKSDWAVDEEIGRKKIERILPGHWNLAQLKIIDEPNYLLPEDAPTLDPPRPENVAWWYKRCFNQNYSLSLAADLIANNDYDVITRFRGDSSLDTNLDYSTLTIDDKIIIPNDANSGWPDLPFSDLFFLGRPDLMKKFFSLGKEFPKYVKIADPNWFQNPVGSWRGEWLSGTFLKHNNMSVVKGPFRARLNTYGRSRFTDKHFHHQIAPDPTEYYEH